MIYVPQDLADPAGAQVRGDPGARKVNQLPKR